ncbi:MAG: SDR family NAD(P)-dependent oxidoreductase [Acidimicrobiales bacterium]
MARRGGRLRTWWRRCDRAVRSGPGSGYRVCDLSDVATFVELLQQVEEECHRIDILLDIADIAGVAGVAGVAGTEEPMASIRAVMEVNFISPYSGRQTLLPGMRQRRSGVIANMSSDEARSPPGPGTGGYPASKASLSAATASLSYLVRPDGFFLHAVYPGLSPATIMGLGAVRDGGDPMPPRPVRRTEEQVSSLALRRLGSPRLEINAAALALVAPGARTVLPVAYQRMRAKR